MACCNYWDGDTRLHGAIEAFQTAREAGFDNVNLDLMYGLPNQSLSQWEDTVARLAALTPEHISLYALTLEEGTPMRVWADQDKIPEPDPDLAADMYALARRVLGDSGYHHYEISNWSRPGLESQHNLIYWRNEPYLGVGPGAHSRLGSYRFWTVLASPGLLRPLLPLEAAARTGGGRTSMSKNCARRRQSTAGSTLTPKQPARKPCSSACGCSTGCTCPTLLHWWVRIWELATVAISKTCWRLKLLRRDGDTLRLDESAYLIANQVFTRFL